jgi:hypothetical protein
MIQVYPAGMTFKSLKDWTSLQKPKRKRTRGRNLAGRLVEIGEIVANQQQKNNPKSSSDCML